MKDITKLLNNRSNIRNISIIGLPDDDTEALKDNILALSGISVADVWIEKIFFLFVRNFNALVYRLEFPTVCSMG